MAKVASEKSRYSVIHPKHPARDTIASMPAIDRRGGSVKKGQISPTLSSRNAHRPLCRSAVVGGTIDTRQVEAAGDRGSHSLLHPSHATFLEKGIAFVLFFQFP